MTNRSGVHIRVVLAAALLALAFVPPQAAISAGPALSVQADMRPSILTRRSGSTAGAGRYPARAPTRSLCWTKWWRTGAERATTCSSHTCPPCRPPRSCSGDRGEMIPSPCLLGVTGSTSSAMPPPVSASRFKDTAAGPCTSGRRARCRSVWTEARPAGAIFLRVKRPSGATSRSAVSSPASSRSGP